MRKRPKQREVLGWVLAVLVAGCGASAIRPATPFRDAVAALGAQRAANQRVSSLRAEARVDQRGSDGRVRGTVLMFVQRPRSVRFDVMTQFGAAAVLTSRGGEFAYMDLRAGRFLRGPTCPKNLARLLNVPLSVEQTTELLLGGTPLIGHDSAQLTWDERGFYRIELRAHDGSWQRIDLELDRRDVDRAPPEQRLRLRRSELFVARDQSQIRATFDDFRALAQGGATREMPFSVRIEQPRQHRDTLIRFKRIELDVAIPEGAFEQQPRPGQPEEEASCDDEEEEG